MRGERDSHASHQCALLKIRQIWRESKLWPKLATRTAAENQQAGLVLVFVTFFVFVSVLNIALVGASLLGVS